MTNRTERRVFALCSVVSSVLILIHAAACAGAAELKLPDAQTRVSDITFVAFDTETTGFGPKNNSILEIGAVKFRKGKVIEEKSWLIKPAHKTSWWALKAHGITQEMLAEQPPFEEVYPEFKEFAKGCVLLAHNATFDVDFMKSDIARAGLKPLPNPCLDSLRLFRALFPDEESHSLEPLSTKLGVDGEVYHRATDDARYIFLILDKALENKPADYSYGQLRTEAGGELWLLAK